MGHDDQWIELTTAIWNRACVAVVGEPPARARDGDRALAALLLAHSLIMNGGVVPTVSALTEAQLDAACEGFRFFELGAAADVLRYAATRLADEAGDDGALEALAEPLDAAYAAVAPDDEPIARAFEDHLRNAPDDFAPLDPADDRS